MTTKREKKLAGRLLGASLIISAAEGGDLSDVPDTGDHRGVGATQSENGAEIVAFMQDEAYATLKKYGVNRFVHNWETALESAKAYYSKG